MPGTHTESQKIGGQRKCLGIADRVPEKNAASAVIIVTSLKANCFPTCCWAVIGEIGYLRGRNWSIN